MIEVPFYSNTPDNMHCAAAVQRSIIEYFTGRKISMEQVERLAGFRNEKAAWTVDIWTRLVKQGFDIRMIEPFDYSRYAKERKKYIHEYFRPDAAEWQLKHSNILELQHLDEFIEIVHPEQRRPTLADIDAMLHEGRLVFTVLNAHELDDRPGYSAHAVLILAGDLDNYIMHDPGLPPHPYRRVARRKLWQALGGDNNTAEVTGITLQTKPIRADILLASMYPAYSRSAIAKLFDKGQVTLQGKLLKAGDKVPPGSALKADLASLVAPVQDIELPVLYEDEDCVVMNKPAGVLTHALSIHGNEPSVASFLRAKTSLAGERAGIVHRLDRATSGVIIGAKNQGALSWLQKQFAQRKTKKVYVALVEGLPGQQEAIIDMPIERNPRAPATFRVGPNGKSAQTHYRVLHSGQKYSLVELAPTTGRTHQLRVHMQKIGHPIVGDPLYGSGMYGDRLFLHAASLEITLPNRTRRTFTAPVPLEFEQKVT